MESSYGLGVLARNALKVQSHGIVQALVVGGWLGLTFLEDSVLQCLAVIPLFCEYW